VRGVQFVPEIETLASISEDCTVKLWSLRGIDHQQQDTDGNIEPYITLRGHTGPLFAISGGNRTHKRLFFTAGSEGLIKIWNLPSVGEVNQYGDTFDGRNYCVGIFSEPTNEAFWDLRHHAYLDVLLSVSAGQQALLWKTADLQMQESVSD
jgi:striatin 1/3/4